MSLQISAFFVFTLLSYVVTRIYTHTVAQSTTTEPHLPVRGDVDLGRRYYGGRNDFLEPSMSYDYSATIDGSKTGSITHKPGVSTWVDISVTALQDAAGASGILISDAVFSLILIDALDATGDVWVRLSPSDAPGDPVTNRLRVKAGASRPFRVRGHIGPDGVGIRTISVALDAPADTIYITGELDNG